MPVKMLQLSKNKGVLDLLSYLNSSSMEFVDFAETHTSILGPQHLENLAFVKRLDLYLMNPNTNKVKLKIIGGTFDKLRALEYLDLSSNLIEFLPDKIFHQNQNLIHLDLSGNCLLLTVINPKYVPIQIKYLYLGYNICFHYPPRNFNDTKQKSTAGAPHNHMLGPSFSKMTQLTLLSFSKPRNLGTNVLLSSQINLFEVTNTTMVNLLKLKTLSKLLFTDCFIRHLDVSVISNFPNLVSIDFSKNLIENITASHLVLNTHNNIPLKANCSGEVRMAFAFNKIGIKTLKNDLVFPKATWLDLRFNFIFSVRDDVFKNMPCLSYIDLRNNPITYIHEKAFKNLFYLKYLYISSTSIFRNKASLGFMRYLKTSPFLHFSLVDDNLFAKIRTSYFRYKSLTNVDLSDNQIPSVDHLHKGLQAFLNVQTLVLKRCGIHFSNFLFPTPDLTHLDLSQNQIRQIMPQFVQSVPLLKKFLISHNHITHIDMNIFRFLPNLEQLDLSHNQISMLSNSNKSLTGYLTNLKILNLQNNYIFELPEKLFPLSLLVKLKHLDLRWNSIECFCEVTRNFGPWLFKNSFFFEERPGFLPQCSSFMQRYGGCVTCATDATKQSNANEKSLLQFATKNLCSSSFSVILTAVFTSCFTLFLSTSLFFSSSKGMLWLAKFSTRRVRSKSNPDENCNFSKTFAFHGFVLFDSENKSAGDWVDDQLLPHLTQKPPYLKILVGGRDDQCGFTSVSQLVFRIKASRKVILVVTGNYWQTHYGNYMLSIIETLHQQTGHSRTVIVTFENKSNVKGLLKARNKSLPWSVLQFPSDEKYLPIFWESLRNSLEWLQ